MLGVMNIYIYIQSDVFEYRPGMKQVEVRKRQRLNRQRVKLQYLTAVS